MQYPNTLSAQEWGMVWGCMVCVPFQDTVGQMTSLSDEHIGLLINRRFPVVVLKERSYPMLAPTDVEDIKGKSIIELFAMLRKGKDVFGWIHEGKAIDIAKIL